MTGLAVKDTLVPGQMAPDGLAATLTLTALVGFTDMVMAFEVAGLPEGQETLEIRIQVTIFPFASVELV